MSDLQVQVHIRPLDGQPHPDEIERLSQFIMAGVELGVSQASQNDVQAFDPHTGEPLFAVSYPSFEAASLISRLVVASPESVINILLRDEEETNMIEHGTMDILWD